VFRYAFFLFEPLRHRLGRGAQIKSKRASLLRFGFDRDLPAVLFDDGTSSRQAQTVAFWLGAEVRIKKPCEILSRYAFAFVPDGNPDVRSFREIDSLQIL